MSSPHFSIATAIEKNRIASSVAMVILLDINVLDSNNTLVETLSIAKNSENVIYQGVEYTAANFTVKLDIDVDEMPSMSISAQDPTGFLRERMEVYAGGVGFEVILTIVNTGNLSQPPEIQEHFKVTQATANEWTVSFTLGIDNPVAQRFPYRIQYQDQCTYAYTGPRCKYSGALTTCDFTLLGPNGCTFHNNAANFGGFPGLTSTNMTSG